MSQPSNKPRNKPCPICRKPRIEEHAPFCSSRCRDRDLVQWLDDGYALPGPPMLDDDIPAEPRED